MSAISYRLSQFFKVTNISQIQSVTGSKRQNYLLPWCNHCFFFFHISFSCCYCLATKLCWPLWDPMNCGPPGDLVCCNSWGRKESDTTERLNWTEASLSMGFPKQESWSGLPFPSPGDLPDRGTEPWTSALQADSLPLSHQGNPM